MKPARVFAYGLLTIGTLLASLSAVGCEKDYPGKYPDEADPPLTPCEESNVCHIWGWCAEVDGECRATDQDMCRGSVACQKGGLCTFEPNINKCVARGDDCLGSTWCDVYEMCKAKDGVCKH